LICGLGPSLKKQFAGHDKLMSDIAIKATAVFEDAEVIENPVKSDHSQNELELSNKTARDKAN
jgi:hypothetical protein